METWFIGTILNVKTGKCRVVSSKNFETIDELEVFLEEDEVLFKNDTCSSGQ
jgi:hypothetical protein